jgi:hypothetical protein
MTELPILRQETFAHALAAGRSRIAASSEAGYPGDWKWARMRAAAAPIATRAVALRHEPAWDETADVAGVIKAMLRLARKAGDMQTAAAMAAARGLLAEAAKLKSGLPETPEIPDGDPADAYVYQPLSDEDWIAKYGRRA